MWAVISDYASASGSFESLVQFAINSVEPAAAHSVSQPEPSIQLSESSSNLGSQIHQGRAFSLPAQTPAPTPAQTPVQVQQQTENGKYDPKLLTILFYSIL